MSKLLRPSYMLLLASFIAGALLLEYGNHLAGWRSDQFYYYNLALVAYKADKQKDATAYFELSLAAYDGALHGDRLHKLILPAPSKEVASLAHFYKGRLLLQSGEVEPAVEAFKDSLRLNSGQDLDGLDAADQKRLLEQAMVVKYDLELLLKKHPELTETKGMGKSKRGDDQEHEQVPKMAPGAQPGQGGRDDI